MWEEPKERVQLFHNFIGAQYKAELIKKLTYNNLQGCDKNLTSTFLPCASNARNFLQVSCVTFSFKILKLK